MRVEALDLHVPVRLAAVERARGDHAVVLDAVEDRAVEPALLADHLGAAAQHQVDGADRPQLGERALHGGQAGRAALDRAQADHAREIRDLVGRAGDLERVRALVLAHDAAQLEQRVVEPGLERSIDRPARVERRDDVGAEQIACAIRAPRSREPR